MGVPNTRGQFRTRVEDMEVGDYIACGWSGYQGYVNNMYGLGDSLETALAKELPTVGSTRPDGYFFFIKARNGMLVADRVVQSGILLTSRFFGTGPHNWYNLYGGSLDKELCPTFTDILTYTEPMNAPYNYNYFGTRSMAVRNDGAYIAMLANESTSNGNVSGQWRIRILKVTATAITKVSDTGWLSTYPDVGVSVAWHPDGKRLFVKYSNNGFRLYKFENESLSSVPVTSDVAKINVYNSVYNGTSMLVSPCGGYLIFSKTGRTSTYTTIGIAKITGDASLSEIPVDINKSSYYDIRFSISPNSKYLVAVVDPVHYQQVFTWYKITDAGLQRRAAPAVTPYIYSNTDAPVWTPDSKYLITYEESQRKLQMYKVENDDFSTVQTAESCSGFWLGGEGTMLPACMVGNTLVLASTYYLDSAYMSNSHVTINYNQETQQLGPGMRHTASIKLGEYNSRPSTSSGYLAYYEDGSNYFTLRVCRPVTNHVRGAYYIRALSGGSSPLDLDGESRSMLSYQLGAWPPDNEYDAIINKSDLDGKITPGDSAVWHDDVMTTITNSRPDSKIFTSNALVTVRRKGNIGTIGSSNTGQTTGIRPVLEYYDPVTPLQTNMWF